MGRPVTVPMTGEFLRKVTAAPMINACTLVLLFFRFMFFILSQSLECQHLCNIFSVGPSIADVDQMYFPSAPALPDVDMKDHLVFL